MKNNFLVEDRPRMVLSKNKPVCDFRMEILVSVLKMEAIILDFLITHRIV
jgi:hypothetical protein